MKKITTVITLLFILMYVQIVSADSDFGNRTYYGNLDLYANDVSFSSPNPEETGIDSVNLYFYYAYVGSYTFEFTTFNTFVPAKAKATDYIQITPLLELRNGGSSIDFHSHKDITVYQLMGKKWYPLPTTKIANQTYRASIERLGVFAIVPIPQNEKITGNQVGIGMETMWQSILEKGFFTWLIESDTAIYNSLNKIMLKIQKIDETVYDLIGQKS